MAISPELGIFKKAGMDLSVMFSPELRHGETSEEEEAPTTNALKERAFVWCYFYFRRAHTISNYMSLDIDSKGVISIKEARKLLGSDYVEAPDDVIEGIIVDMTFLADAILKWHYCSTKSEGVV